MYALHSSSAAACNLFHYWHARDDISPVARACKLPSTAIERLDFEAKLPIDERFSRPPNVDAAIRYRRGSLEISAVECKFSEPYGRPHSGLDPKYLEDPSPWQGLRALRALAHQISPDDTQFKRFHAAQIVKHILGLTANHGLRGFRLLYCWYDAPGSAAVLHRAEIERFQDVAASDGIRFQATTYQDVIMRLANALPAEHRSYSDYLAERYL